jgi:hypothetical protein
VKYHTYQVGDVKSLEISPGQRKMSYRCFGMPPREDRFALGPGRNIARDFTEEEFHAAVHQLVPQRPEFGLFNILDELAGLAEDTVRSSFRW